jgi:hypothetical protein
VAVIGIEVGLLDVPVVEAAPVVHVRAAGDHVLTLRLAAGRDTRGGVVAVADAGRHVDAVDRVPGDRHRQRGRVRGVILSAGPARTFDGEVVVPRRLVVDLGDGARRAGAEGVLRGGVGVAAGGEGADIRGRVVLRALDLVEVSAVRGEQRSHGAVRGDARRAGRAVDVARE